MNAPHHFRDPLLEETALTHKSFGRPNNERLEWLGDSVLEFEVSRLLYGWFGDLSEGGLTLARGRLVCGETLATLARRLELAPRLRLGASAATERDNDNILAGAMEAYIAAVYLDGGDAGALIAEWMEEDIAAVAEILFAHGVAGLRDAKTLLQEHLQQSGLPPPSYVVLKTEGEAHRRVFLVECRAQEGVAAQASASSLTAAKKLAAEECLRQLRAEPPPSDDN